jgi:AraC-like DNA-binding protein
MPDQASGSGEVVDVRRLAGVPGIEVIHARRSPREWRVLSGDWAVVMFRTWRGSVRSRGGVHIGQPGFAFCYTPGEVMVANPLGGPGSFSVLQLSPELFEQCLAERQPRSARSAWARTMNAISPRLLQQFSGFVEAFGPATSAMQVQTQLLELSQVMISELVQGARQPRPLTGPPIRAAARMRECLNDEGLNIDLETLAKRAGLSRFEALRAFKKRYGLPPHAYQLCLRIERARRLLVEGAPAAEVALRCGFADQSHFNRHFKRLNGVTPMQYAHAHVPPKRRAPVATRDSLTLLARSDR